MNIQIRTDFFLSTPHGTLGTEMTMILQIKINIFQLHTVHQEPSYQFSYLLPGCCGFQLHTVHQELAASDFKFFQENTFNSTRCIRNLLQKCICCSFPILSTPHGALGTPRTFGSRIYCLLRLSTPHGALGTKKSPPQGRAREKLSTPHGALGTNTIPLIPSDALSFQLHTVHQEL